MAGQAPATHRLQAVQAHALLQQLEASCYRQRTGSEAVTVCCTQKMRRKSRLGIWVALLGRCLDERSAAMSFAGACLPAAAKASCHRQQTGLEAVPFFKNYLTERRLKLLGSCMVCSSFTGLQTRSY